MLKKLLLILSLLFSFGLLYAQDSGLSTPIHYGPSLPSGALVNTVFIKTGSGSGLYRCTNSPTCTLTSHWSRENEQFLGVFTVSTLPSGAANPSLALITDSNPNCTIGGGSSLAWCEYDGTTWHLVGAGSAGTVSSVSFTGDGTILSSTPSTAVTTNGSLVATLNTQPANCVLAGPLGGAAATPTCRSLISADIPLLPYLPATGAGSFSGIITGGSASGLVAQTITSNGTLSSPSIYGNSYYIGTTGGSVVLPSKLTGYHGSGGGAVKVQLNDGTGFSGIAFFGPDGSLSGTPSGTLGVGYGGTGNTSLSGLVRGSGTGPLVASELSGDCYTSGSNAIVCTKSNGVSFASGAFNPTLSLYANGQLVVPTTGGVIYISPGTNVSFTQTTNGFSINSTSGGIVTYPSAGIVTSTGSGFGTSYTVLPVSLGGTGSNTQNFVDLTTNQTIAGIKTFGGNVVINSGYSLSAPNVAIGNGLTATVITSSYYNIGTNTVLPSTTTGYHGTNGLKVQFSDGSGTNGNWAKFAVDGSLTDGGYVPAPLNNPNFNGTALIPTLNVSTGYQLNGTAVTVNRSSLKFNWIGTLPASQIFAQLLPDSSEVYSFPVSGGYCVNSRAVAYTSDPSNATTINIVKNGSTVGTVTFASGSTTGSVNCSSAFSLSGSSGDYMYLQNSSSPTALAGISIAFYTTHN